MKKKWRERKGPTQKEKVQKLLEVLEDGVANFIQDEEVLMAIFKMKALMPSYTFQNLILAKSQLPRATYVAGYKRWQELGRFVKKGEKALQILAPRFKKVTDKDTGEEKSEMTGYISVPVFDYSQTDGDPLPIDKVKVELEGDCIEARNIISLAEKIAKQDNCPITYGDSGIANGFYKPFEHSITVSDKLSINHRCKTLVHELVHSKVDRLENLKKTSNKEKEVVAEGTAFIVCSYFGLDTSDYSFSYVKGWSQNDDNALAKFGKRICDTSELIINEFEELVAEGNNKAKAA